MNSNGLLQMHYDTITILNYWVVCKIGDIKIANIVGKLL